MSKKEYVWGFVYSIALGVLAIGILEAYQCYLMC